MDDDDDGNACLIEIGVGVDFNAEIKVVLALVVVTSFPLDVTRLASLALKTGCASKSNISPPQKNC